jgi:Lon protease-like protein
MNLPEQVGVIVLPQTVFFPHHLLPLHIFEPRYRTMLQQALEGSRMFAVTSLSRPSSHSPHIGGLGLIRSCVLQPDGTSNLVLQGLARVRLDHLLQTSPFIIASPEPVEDSEPSTPGAIATQEALVAKILERIENIENPAGPSFEDVKKFIRHLENHHAFVDLIGGCFLRDPKIRQTVLQTTSLTERLRLLLHSL